VKNFYDATMKRKTTIYERILYHMGNTSLMHFAFRLKVKGIFSQDELKEALYKLQQKHPLAGVRVIMTEDKKQYITTENVPPIPLNQFNEKETDWKAVAGEELCSSFDIFKGPMVHVFLSQEEDISDIVFVFHHAICDGLSAVVLLHDLFSFLTYPLQQINPYKEAPIFSKLIKKDILDLIKSKGMPEWLKNIEIKELKHIKGEPFPKPDYMIHNWSFTEDFEDPWYISIQPSFILKGTAPAPILPSSRYCFLVPISFIWLPLQIKSGDSDIHISLASHPVDTGRLRA